jgi:hypothetical protein
LIVEEVKKTKSLWGKERLEEAGILRRILEYAELKGGDRIHPMTRSAKEYLQRERQMLQRVDTGEWTGLRGAYSRKK